MKVALNKASDNMKNKVYPIDMAQYTYSFRNYDIEPREFYEAVAVEGYPFCIAELEEGEYGLCHKTSANFVSSRILVVDKENDVEEDYWSYEEAINDSDILKNALFIYTTPSHTLEHNKFRIVFLLPDTLTDMDEVVQLNKALNFKFNGDTATVSCVQSFFGNSNSESIYYGNTYDSIDLDEMVRMFDGGGQ